MKKLLTLIILISLCLNFSAFAENDGLSRIEFITYVMSSVGVINSDEPAEFSDLPRNDKYYNYVAAAKEYGVITGYSDGTLRPYEKITREEAVVILARAYMLEQTSGVYIKGFTDFLEIKSYSVGYISTAVRNGIIGYEAGGKFNPESFVSVEEMYQLTESCKRYIADTMHFSFGYPKISKEQVYNAVTVSVKASRPCTVYYKLLPTQKYMTGFKLKPHEVTEFLTSVSIADVNIDVNIYPGDLEDYHLYLVAVDNDGNYTGVECINDVTAHRFPVGDGSETSPYLIYTREQLEGIKYYPKAHYRLENDIEIAGEWEPIEVEKTGYLGFSGVLDGGYHSIKGIEINSYRKNAGLFSAIYGGRVKKLYVDATVKGKDNVGIIAGLSEGGTVEECFVTGRAVASGNNAGGIIGSNNGKVENSVSAAYMVEASNYAGGITGTNRGDVFNCLSAVYSVSADMYASSVSGVNIGGRINYNVAASLYADDVITTKSGRITTNKQYGRTKGNFCYDKMMSNSSVNFDEESHDGMEVSWEELTSPEFYSGFMGWDTENIWNDFVTEDFRLLSLRGFDAIDMIKGITMYAPVKLETANDLLKVHENPDYHYILANDITLGENFDWKMIGADESEDSGFNGTFDGNNHTVSGLRIVQDSSDKVYGMFGVISAGTVRNLKLINVAIEGNSIVGGIAGINHGYIENCSVKGKIYALRKGDMLSVGGIAGDNHGIIENVSANVKIRADGKVLTVGGIVANNDGFIDMADYKGDIDIQQKTAGSNAVAGGIVGINTGGYIYNSYSDGNIDSWAAVNYMGGISGIMNGGEIYKASADGKIYVDSGKGYESTAYVGGVTGLIPEGLIMNSFSVVDIFVDSNMPYVGGVAGYNQNASLQNTYSAGLIDSVGGIYDGSKGYAAGICGFSESGFISDNVVLVPIIEANGFVDEVCNSDSEHVSVINNYFRSDMEMYGEVKDGDRTGKSVSIKDIKEDGFFFKAIADGGQLGWIGADVWYKNGDYPYPVLYNVKNQENFKKNSVY